MLSKEKELRSGMVELTGHARWPPRVPGVARFAGCGERAPMGVLVASVAGGELQPREPDEGARLRRLGMALLALHLDMRGCELIFRLGMVETRGGFPL